ncbi:MAG: discoidin domain-containing protein [bacterium]|nr:discoidin domain-containing protein [bacterium]
MRTALTCLLCAVAFGLPAMAQEDFDEFNEAAKAPEARPSENIALNASYTLQPAPNYSYCTDAADKTQLTDGAYTEGYFWVEKSTVGWKVANPAIITIDLGEVRPIRGVSYHTGAGRAGVAWPTAIQIFVADKPKEYRPVGDLCDLGAVHGLPPEGYGTHRYWTDELKARGRYVAFVVVSTSYAFVDEVEVYEGDAAWLEVPVESDTIANLKEHVKGQVMVSAVKRRIRRDVAAVREGASAAGVSEDARRAVIADLDAISEDLAELQMEIGPDFTTELPLSDLHRRVFQANAKVWQAGGLRPVTVWKARPWDMLRLFTEPELDASPAVNVHLMGNEYRAGAFNMSNATDEDHVYALSFSGIPGGATPDWITVHEVAWTDTGNGVPVASALPEAEGDGDAYRITVPSGMTRQVWLTFHPKDVAQGAHAGSVELRSGSSAASVPLTATVYPMQFPDEPNLHFGGWDYTDGDGHRGVTPANRDALIAHLRERFVDSPWATGAVMPYGTFDSEGAMTAKPDTARFDAWVAMWAGARQYMVFNSVGNTMGGLKMGAPAFDKAVAAWAEFWADHVKGLGLDPAQIALLLVDEPHRAETDEIIVAWAKPIRAAETGMRIWEDPIYRDMRDANPEMLAACDVICPNRTRFVVANQETRDLMVEYRDRGAALEFYSCSGPARLLDPYVYYRLQAWTCWQYDAEATYFWAFGDTSGASSWNEYAASRTAYVPMFLGTTSVTAGKQMEACREGIEDFEYLVMLRDAIDRAVAKKADEGLVAKAKALLEGAVAQVLAEDVTTAFDWSDDVDRSVADEFRIEILKLLKELPND